MECCSLCLDRRPEDADFHHCSISSVRQFWVRLRQPPPSELFPSLPFLLGTQVSSERVQHQCFTESKAVPVQLQLNNCEKGTHKMEHRSPAFQVGSTSWSHQEEGARNSCQSYCLTVKLGKRGKREEIQWEREAGDFQSNECHTL